MTDPMFSCYLWLDMMVLTEKLYTQKMERVWCLVPLRGKAICFWITTPILLFSLAWLLNFVKLLQPGQPCYEYCPSTITWKIYWVNLYSILPVKELRVAYIITSSILFSQQQPCLVGEAARVWMAYSAHSASSMAEQEHGLPGPS